MKKILWASPNNLLDTSSGFALAVKEILLQLKKYGYEIKILSATVFDAKAGALTMQNHKNYNNTNINKFIEIKDEGLTHLTLICKSILRKEMQSYEEIMFLNKYTELLDEFEPDIMFFCRDGLLELEMAYQSKQRSIKTLSYLANPSYTGKRWIENIDLLITDSLATSRMYKQREDYDSKAIGLFIPKEKYLSKEHKRKNVLFINPSLEKGVLIVMQLALIMEKTRPDIKFEILESRGNWSTLLKNVTSHFGNERTELSNVIVRENTSDMKSIYSQTRILLVPSLWFESAGRVIPEAQLNGIPVIGTGRGGSSEMIGDGGIISSFPKEFYEPPYNKSLPRQKAEELISIIEKFYDDENYYEEYSKKALQNYEQNHNIDKNTKRLIDAMESIK